jgi:hypothetical protein
MDRKKLAVVAGLSISIIVLVYVFATSYFAPWIAPPIVNADPDGDGLFNEQEKTLGTDPLNNDTDNDGLDDGLEVELGISPVDFDTDDDGLGDGREVELGTSALDIDSDDDGLEDGFEVNSFGTDPLIVDTDLDGLSDKEEQNHGTDALLSDTDADGASDYDEIFVRYTNPLIPDVSLMLTIKDEETALCVKNVRVYIDGIEMGSTTEQGTILLNTISVGQHDVSIAYTGYGTIDVGYMTVNKGTTSLDLFVDMPNPQLVFSLSVDEWLSGLFPPNQVGQATVTLGNQGNLPSKDTMALIIVYDLEAEEVLDQDLIRLGSVAIGESTWKKSEVLDTSYWHDEYVLAILFDGSEYLPEKDLETLISAPGSVVDDLTRAVCDYLAKHPEIVGKIIGVALKTVLGV